MNDSKVAATRVAGDLAFPEGPVDLGDGRIAVVEIGAGRITGITIADGTKEAIAETGGGPNGAAFGPDGKLYVCNNGGFAWQYSEGGMRAIGPASTYTTGSIQRVDTDTGAVETLFTQCDGEKLNGPNDLVFDRDGGFYFTDMGKKRERTQDRGSVYYVPPGAQSIRRVVEGMHTPNGIALSPDECTLYVSETETARLWEFAISRPGELLLQPFPSPNGGAIVYGAGGFERFDSMKVEASGNICVACIESAAILVVDPSGAPVEMVRLPRPYVTNLCFTGTELDSVVVTHSMPGEVSRLPWPRQGLRLNFAR